MTERLTRRFYRRDPVRVAKSLLGQNLVRCLDDGTRLSGRIVEVEAYLGIEDRAAHSFGGRRTARNESMWRDGGTAYVYFVYGMHWCFNVVTEREGAPSAVLIRAIEPVEGIERMRRLRGGRKDVELCSGPARLAQALGIDRVLDGIDLVTDERLFVARGARATPSRVGASPRVGVGYAEEWASKPLRFYVRDDPHVSRTRS